MTTNERLNVNDRLNDMYREARKQGRGLDALTLVQVRDRLDQVPEGVTIEQLVALWNFVHAEPRNDGSDMIRFDHLRSMTS